jgi:hypothetical protein
MKELGAIILAVAFIGGILFLIGYCTLGTILYDRLEDKYRKEWEDTHPNELIRIKELDKEIEALEPNRQLLHTIKKQIDDLTTEMKYIANTETTELKLLGLKRMAETLIEDERRWYKLLGERNDICHTWSEYIQNKMPKWLKY